VAEIPSIVIIEDHPVMREGLAAFFAKTGRWNVAGTASGLEEAKRLLALTPVDMVLIDIQLEDGWGLDIIPWYKSNRNNVPDNKEKPDNAAPFAAIPLMAVYTSFNDHAHVGAALGLGVKAYITKHRNQQELENALLKALAGETYIDNTSQYKVDTFDKKIKFLSKREAEILTLVRQKQSVKQVAAKLNISPRTVENILSSVYAKFGVHSRYELELM
jgi:NarL family two-component system response regulator LiaR